MSLLVVATKTVGQRPLIIRLTDLSFPRTSPLPSLLCHLCRPKRPVPRVVCQKHTRL